MTRRFTRAAAALATVSMLWSAGAMAQERARFLTAPTGSIVHTTGSAIASVISQNTSLTVLAMPMAGPQVFVPQVNAGQAEFTLMNAADSYEALRGVKPSYQTAHKNLRVAAVGFTNELGLITRRDSGIATGQDLKGKRVTGSFSAHKTCEMLASAQLANLGLSWDDVQVVPVTHSRQAVQALADGRAEAALCVPVGQAIVQEVNAQSPIRFISLDNSAAAVERTRKHFPVGVIATHKAGSSVGVVDDVHVWSYPFYLVANKDVSPDVVYTVVEGIAKNIDKLRGVSGVFKRWDPKAMVDANITIPVHDGAVRYFEQQGMWTAEVKAAHEKMLKEAQ